MLPRIKLFRNCFPTLSHTRSTCVFAMTNKKNCEVTVVCCTTNIRQEKVVEGKGKKGGMGGRTRETPHTTRVTNSFSQANPKVFYILGEFVIVVYQERGVYISKNAGHTITDFN